jgi:demethylmenaquinone methyltransferase/2-methoxy-6-polyprenyl-1,4-benzoquinol methylase
MEEQFNKGLPGSRPPIHQVPGRKEQVRDMFDSIAGRYDFLNHFLSLGIDRIWRKKLISRMAADKPSKILDLASGTADLAIEAARATQAFITGTDISAEMLAFGREKIRDLGLEERIILLIADSEHLPFGDNSYDAAMVAFGVRNYENLQEGLDEMNRVLKPGGKAYILEFAKPGLFPVKQLFSLYFRFVLPLLGKLISKHRSAYTYLPESVSVFPQGEDFCVLMTKSGFSDVAYSKLSFGIAMLYTGVKMNS